MKIITVLGIAILFSFGSYAQTDTINRKHHDMNKDHINHEMDQNKTHNNPGDKSLHQSHPDGVMMRAGKMILVKDGHMKMLDHIVVMTNGTKVMNNGEYVKKDGTKVIFKEGEHMDMSGKIKQMKNLNNPDDKSNINSDKDKMYLVPDSTLKDNKYKE